MGSQSGTVVPAANVQSLRHKDFPPEFVFGVSSSSFQYEGSPESRGVSIWDTFLIKKFTNLEEQNRVLKAVDHLNRYKDDVKIIKQMGFQSYRFSISWPRVLPYGRWRKDDEAGVDQKGIAFYNDLIDELKRNDIEPVACLFHWDLPQVLEDEYEGFLQNKIVEDFRNYADLCFKKFGDRVKKWITFNEPWTFTIGGYLAGTTAPGRGALDQDAQKAWAEVAPPPSKVTANGSYVIPLKKGNPYREIYVVAHHLLLAHAAAAKLYKDQYKASQNGEIGIIVVSMWAVPYTNTNTEKEATLRAVDFVLGWFLEPLIKGDYPKSMRTYVKERLPLFTKGQADDLKASFDFIGLNYYTSSYTRDRPMFNKSMDNLDAYIIWETEKDGKPIGEQGASSWLYQYADGLKQLLLHIKEKYNNPPIYITENGIDDENKENDKDFSLWEALYDHRRISYHYDHLQAIKEAISQKVNVQRYYAWSLLDNLEGGEGFKCRFGLNYVDFKNNYERYPKLSAFWFKSFLEN